MRSTVVSRPSSTALFGTYTSGIMDDSAPGHVMPYGIEATAKLYPGTNATHFSSSVIQELHRNHLSAQY